MFSTFLKELIEIASGAFALYISFSEFRGRKRKATRLSRLSIPKNRRR
jgi:hypothetical protein